MLLFKIVPSTINTLTIIQGKNYKIANYNFANIGKKFLKNY